MTETEAGAPAASARGPISRLEIVALVATLALGLLNLPFPFTGDQAFFAVGAQEMAQGKLLYRDFWDIKTPGIFLFYFVAGKLFGFTEIGIHAFELLYMMTFAALLLLALRGQVRRPALKAALPLLTVGIYYTVTWAVHLTQVEGLVGPWLFLSLWLSTRRFGMEGRRGAVSLFGAGVAGGIAAVFKVLFLPIVAGFALIALVETLRRRPDRKVRVVLQEAALFGAGVLVPLLAVGLSFAAAGTLSLLLETAFVIPSRVAMHVPAAEFERQMWSLIWFVAKFWPLLLAAGIAIAKTLRNRDDPLRMGLVVWLVLGIGVIQVQRQSLWEYHYLLLFIPLGVLAVLGLEPLLDAVATRPFFQRGAGRWVLPLIGLVLVLGFAKSVVNRGFRLVRHRGAIREEARRAFRIDIHPAYGIALQQIDLLRAPESVPGAVYVAGNPLIYFLSGREQATSMNGWAGNFFLPEQWVQLRCELGDRRPPYVFVAPEYQQMFSARAPELTRFLEDAYTPLRRTPEGVWLQRR